MSTTGSTQTHQIQEAIDLETFISDHYVKELKRLIKNKHYFVAFLVISSGIEFLGKAISNHGWFTDNKSKSDFHYALSEFASLRKYDNMGLQSKNGRDESLYAIVRCGIVHASRPLDGISLSDGYNNLPHDIGIIDFSKDFLQACEDLLQGNVSLGRGKRLTDVICYY